MDEETSLLKYLTKSSIDNSNRGKVEFLAIDQLLRMIKVNENIKTGSITISVNSNSPILSSLINNLLISELKDYQSSYFKTKTGKTRRFIEERIKDTDIELKKAENTLKNFRDRNRRIENSPSLLLEEQRLGRDVAVLTGVFTTLKQQLETTKIEEVKESDFLVVLDPPEVPISYSWPSKRKFVMFVGFIGLAVGLFIGFLFEYLNNETKGKLNTLKKTFFSSFKLLFKLK